VTGVCFLDRIHAQRTDGLARVLDGVAGAAANADLRTQATTDAADADALVKRYPRAQVRDFDGNPRSVTEADALIEAAAGFVAYGRTKGLPETTIDRVNQLLETVYKSRFPEDAELEGLKKILADKGAPPA